MVDLDALRERCIHSCQVVGFMRLTWEEVDWLLCEARAAEGLRAEVERLTLIGNQMLARADKAGQAAIAAESQLALCREALEPFAVIGRAIAKATKSNAWLEAPLFFAGTDDDPQSMTLTGRAFNNAALTLSSTAEGESVRWVNVYDKGDGPFTWNQNLFESEAAAREYGTYDGDQSSKYYVATVRVDIPNPPRVAEGRK